MTHRTAAAALGAALALCPSFASAQLAVTALDVAVEEDFTGFTGAGFAPTPAAGQLDSDTWRVTGASDGDLAFGDTGDTGDYARGTSSGGVSTGGVYAFEALGAGNPALGAQPSGSDFTPGSFVLRVRNDTGDPVVEWEVEFTGCAYNDQDRATTARLGWSTDDVTFTGSATAFFSPETADAMPEWACLPVTDTFEARVPDGGFLYLRILSDDGLGSGSRDELALDDFSIAATESGRSCTVDADCDDGNACVTNTCDGAEICLDEEVANGTPCPDEDICDGVETCEMGRCSAGRVAAMGTACPDDDLCNGDETCDGAGACTAGPALDCDDANLCTTDRCDATLGCENENLPADTSCDDGDVCNGVSLCDDAGVCVAGAALVCDDGNVCTTDGCDAVTGCLNAPVAEGTACPDGDACNGAETCSAVGLCVEGTSLDCDDGNECTADSCDMIDGCANVPVDGCCQTAADCDDGDECTADACTANVCENTAIVGCGEDAGMPMVDAGPPDDQGTTAGLDAGPTDPAGDGCSCRALGTGSSPGGPWLALGSLALFALRRRRRPTRSP